MRGNGRHFRSVFGAHEHLDIRFLGEGEEHELRTAHVSGWQNPFTENAPLYVPRRFS
jgi:hypothetical protein